MYYREDSPDLIRLVIADSDPQWRERMRRLFDGHPVIRVTAVAGTGEQCLRLVRDTLPDAVLLDYALGDMDGLTVAEQIAKLAPGTVVIMYTDHPSQELAKRSASLVHKLIRRPISLQDAAGPVEHEVSEARRKFREMEELPVAPAGTGPLRARFGRQVQERGRDRAVAVPRQVVLVCSPKGGVGKTSLTVNMACAASSQGIFKPRVAVVDLNEFGCVTIQMNLGPPDPEEALIDGRVPRTILSWREVEGEVTDEDLAYLMVQHGPSGVWVVPSVPAPEMLEEVTEELVQKVVRALRRHFDLVLIDAPPSVNLHPTWLGALEADKILVICTPDVQVIPGLHQLRRVFEHPQLAVSQRCYRVVNQFDMPYGLSMKDLDYYAPWPCIGMVPDTPEIREYIKRGEPYVLAKPNSAYAAAVRSVVNEFFPVFAAETLRVEAYREKAKGGLFGRLLRL
ncbi:MinD-like ATPase involved in chromosome partitioning or flagellar assembly [Thermanaeromonas toyohensis ToBE]|uniref:Stage 0 sporulation protein A homolog n=1 Tax=Thermanaeromonas toyohensis ToBE TaxID=698762 RepID=A0A1W1VT97_9FIRM|nr:response regulator [Thermanaeromonas toyohensis]SMB96493.1 MinD-like ATPase involved in chromosome partitioning or flagellar assembly [Thermanaeromonas toyohensis ToBE]